MITPNGRTDTDRALDRIAAALEVIAADITERKAQEQASLVSQYRHLQTVARQAHDRFRSADNAMARRDADRISERDREWHRDCESAMEDADAALVAFCAAHPNIREMAGVS